MRPSRAVSDTRASQPTSCPYCLVHETEKQEYLELENSMSRRKSRFRPPSIGIRSSALSSSSAASGQLHGKWRTTISSLLGMGKKIQEKDSPQRSDELISWLFSSGVFQESDSERIEAHLAKLPSIYCSVGFTPSQLKDHMELIEEAVKLKDGFVALRMEVRVDDDPADVSDSSCSSSAGGFSSLSCESGPEVCKVEASFACGSHICRPNLASALKHAGFSIISLVIYDVSPRGALGHTVLKVCRDDLSKEILESVFSSVIVQRTPSSRWLPLSIIRGNSGEFSAEDLFSDRRCDLEPLSLRGSNSSSKRHSPGMSHRRTMTSSTGDILQVLQGKSNKDRKTNKVEIERYILDPLKLEMGPTIAMGASGEVRKGTYEGNEVAVKILKTPLRRKNSESLLAEFRREVLTLVACGECPYLLKFYGIFVDVRERLCIVTKYMPGGNLHDYFHKRNGEQLPMTEVLTIATDIAMGMEYLHKSGITHRDLKSANVLLDGEGHAVVADFGVAKLKAERGEMTKEVGTYRWMAPEAFGTSAWPVTHKSDVYSFGIVLWELVSLLLPFATYSPVQAAVAVTLNGLRPTIPNDTPAQLSALIERCWAKNPDDRPEFSEVLQCLCSMSTVTQHPDTA